MKKIQSLNPYHRKDYGIDLYLPSILIIFITRLAQTLCMRVGDPMSVLSFKNGRKQDRLCRIFYKTLIHKYQCPTTAVNILNYLIY